ncbi:mitochondrial inner membrane protease [Cladorrhinum sp. PSN259]|nr:mitochondrial inner membrane protease [Cladorrhinum sp. PSN259]
MATRWANAAAAGQRYEFVKRFSHYLIRYATWLPPFIWVNQYVAEVTFINGPSMYPFFNASYNESTRRDLCLVWKMNAQQDLQRGEVVVFRSPTDPNKIAVKRIIALEGDVVRTKGTYPYPSVCVQEGHVWVEGDNADKSRDSNYYGPISVRLITGRVGWVLSPWERAGRVRWWEAPVRRVDEAR